MKYQWFKSYSAPFIDDRDKKEKNKDGSVIVFRDGKSCVYPGPISLEQFYGKTSDPMEWQPSGNTMEVPVSYWMPYYRDRRILPPLLVSKLNFYHKQRLPWGFGESRRFYNRTNHVSEYCCARAVTSRLLLEEKRKKIKNEKSISY